MERHPERQTREKEPAPENLKTHHLHQHWSLQSLTGPRTMEAELEGPHPQLAARNEATQLRKNA